MTTTTEFTAYSELGYITAIGLVLMLAVTFLVLPALIFLAGRGKQLKSPELPGIGHLPAVVRAGRLALPVVAVALVALGATTYGGIGFNMRYFDFLPDSTESASGLRHIQDDKTLSPIQAGAGADSVKQARALADKLRALKTVGAVQTATDALPELTEEGLTKLRAGFRGLEREPDFDKLRRRKRPSAELQSKVRDLGDVLDEVRFAVRQGGRKPAAVEEAQAAAAELSKRAAELPDDAPELAAFEQRTADVLQRAWTTAKAVADRGHYLPTDLPSVFRARFVSKDGKALAVYATPAGDIWDAEVARQFSTEVEAVAPQVAGMAINIHHHQRMIREGFTRAAMFSAALVLVILLVGFRRLGDALLAMLPVVVGVGWLLGMMGALDLDFNVANVVVPALILGIGIDAGAHMTHRWRQSADEHGGVANLDEMLRGTGAAVLMASLTTATGFAALMLADYGAMKSVGLMMTLGVGACMVAALLVLPALLVLLKRAK
ncbi:MAG: MMPL family transporter [Deltaproteobacteria bacterium]|nr:MMPL family transporter [Deltaproteobacteria bacterium]